MSLIGELTRIIEDGERQAEETKAVSLKLRQENKNAYGCSSENILCHGDNLTFMKSLLALGDIAGKINMIYIDPPFFSKANYDAVVKAGDTSVKLLAYKDSRKGDLESYLQMITARIFLMKDLLADDGLIWLHLDWHVVHYVKLIMDEILGSENFVNEIIWTYKSGGSTNKHFARKHDTILVYSKTPNYKFYPLREKSYNRGFKPYRFKGVEEFQDDKGWYTMVNMKDVWSIDMVGRTSSERTGYATQKPEQLLRQIIESSTKEGDICADFFCGSGTLPAVAAKMNRRFIACDEGDLAIASTGERLNLEKSSFSMYDLNLSTKPKIKVDFDVSFDGEEVTIQLKSLKEKELETIVEEKSIESIKKALKRDSLCLVKSWSVDFDFDGKVHRPSQIFIRNKQEIPYVCTEGCGLGNIINVKVVDVFGNVYYERVENERYNKK